ncbi:hypothetical protein [Alishewanella phage vB_AspM_Slicko01]|nr:hypothetical protein [Alishewanella phage vB_AspM_Slicko01]
MAKMNAEARKHGQHLLSPLHIFLSPGRMNRSKIRTISYHKDMQVFMIQDAEHNDITKDMLFAVTVVVDSLYNAWCIYTNTNGILKLGKLPSQYFNRNMHAILSNIEELQNVQTDSLEEILSLLLL